MFRFKSIVLIVLLTAVLQLQAFELEVERAKVWQTSNEVQIPNNSASTRFSLTDIVGEGPLDVTRLYVTWELDEKQSLRVLYAPLSYTLSGNSSKSINFAGKTYAAGNIEATYQFNSYRLTYRYLYQDESDFKLWLGFTAKIRDAKVALSQGTTRSQSTDVGFVPLFHIGSVWSVSDTFDLIFDMDGLAGGPGRAFDIALKLRYWLTDDLGLSAGYRTLEGGADVQSAYNFAWLNYAVVSLNYKF